MSQGKSKVSTSSLIVVVLAVALVITASILVHVLFSRNVNELTVELLAAIIAVVLVVASVGVTIHFQVASEIEREYRVELFRQKLKLYEETIDCITKADDDGRIDEHEIEQMRNKARKVALVGSKELVKSLADLVQEVEESKTLIREKDKGSFRSVVHQMRKDLHVVKEDDKGEDAVKKQIKRLMKKNGC